MGRLLQCVTIICVYNHIKLGSAFISVYSGAVRVFINNNLTFSIHMGQFHFLNYVKLQYPIWSFHSL